MNAAHAAQPGLRGGLRGDRRTALRGGLGCDEQCSPFFDQRQRSAKRLRRDALTAPALRRHLTQTAAPSRRRLRLPLLLLGLLHGSGQSAYVFCRRPWCVRAIMHFGRTHSSAIWPPRFVLDGDVCQYTVRRPNICRESNILHNGLYQIKRIMPACEPPLSWAC